MPETPKVPMPPTPSAHSNQQVAKAISVETTSTAYEDPVADPVEPEKEADSGYIQVTPTGCPINAYKQGVIIKPGVWTNVKDDSWIQTQIKYGSLRVRGK